MNPSVLLEPLKTAVLQEACAPILVGATLHTPRKRLLRLVDAHPRVFPSILEELRLADLRTVTSRLQSTSPGQTKARHIELIVRHTVNSPSARPSSRSRSRSRPTATLPHASALPVTTAGTDQTATGFRFSGHQSFPLRLSWLPKVIPMLVAGRDPLTDIDMGITELGLGKNMVEALRSWIEAFDIAQWTDRGWSLTEPGRIIFDPTQGCDPFLEHHTTAWLLHWLIATNMRYRFFAWECMFNRWTTPEFSEHAVITAFTAESATALRPLSPATIQQHWDVFIHSYRPTRAAATEDHLDCVLANLNLIAVHEAIPGATQEDHYTFDFACKRSIPNELFAYCLERWWSANAGHEDTVRIADIIGGERSPGRIFKMTEPEITQRVELLARRPQPSYDIVDSAHMRMLHRIRPIDPHEFLRNAYDRPSYV